MRGPYSPNFTGVLSRFQRIRGFRIIGHNLTRFDLPFLYTRMLRHNIDGEREIYRRLVEGGGGMRHAADAPAAQRL